MYVCEGNLFLEIRSGEQQECAGAFFPVPLKTGWDREIFALGAGMFTYHCDPHIAFQKPRLSMKIPASDGLWRPPW